MDLSKLPYPPFSLGDKLVDYTSLGLLIANWAYPISCNKYLPEKLTIKFGRSGQSLKEGSKRIIFLSSFVGTAGLLFCAYRARFPEPFIYFLNINPSNYKSLYRLARSFYIFSGMFIQLFTFSINFLMIHSHKLDNEMRISWMQKGIIGLIATALIGYSGIFYLLKKFLSRNHIV